MLPKHARSRYAIPCCNPTLVEETPRLIYVYRRRPTTEVTESLKYISSSRVGLVLYSISTDINTISIPGFQPNQKKLQTVRTIFTIIQITFLCVIHFLLLDNPTVIYEQATGCQQRIPWLTVHF